MSEKSIVEKLSSLKNELEYAQSKNKLSPEGLRMLKLIDDGAWADDGLASFLQGASLNFSDEIIGSVKSIMSPNTQELQNNLEKYNLLSTDSLDLGIALERLETKEFAEKNPVKSLALETAGAITTGLIPGVSAARTVKGAVATGGAAGFVSGVGGAEGNISDRFGEGVFTGILSGGLGGGLELSSRLGAKLYSPIKSLFQSNKTIGKELARQLIKQSIQNDAGSVEEGLKIILEKTTNKPYSIADLGENTQALLDAVAILPGVGRKKATEFLRNRDTGSLQRLSSDLSEAFGDGANFFDEFLALKVARSEKGSKLYEKAYKSKIPVSETLSNLLKREAFKDAERTAKRMYSNKGVEIPPITISDKGDFLITPKGSNKPVAVKAIDTEYLDFLKRGIDKQIFTKKKNDGSPLSMEEIQILTQLKNEFVGYIDKYNPSFKAARDYWTDETSILKAMDRGRNFETEANKSFNEFRRDILNMTEGEKTGLRLGMMQKMLQKIGGQAGGKDAIIPSSTSNARNILKNSDNISILRSTFSGNEKGQKKFNAFISNLKSEVEMRSTAMAVLGNSKTASRLEIVNTINKTINNNAESPDGLFNLIQKTLKRDTRGMEDKQREELSHELARILTLQLKNKKGSDADKVKQLYKEIMGKDIATILRSKAPELLPALGRSAIAPTVPASLASEVTETPIGQSSSRFIENFKPSQVFRQGLLTDMPR